MIDSVPIRISASLSVRLLGLERDDSGIETYHVSARSGLSTAPEAGTMTHAGGGSWALVLRGSRRRSTVDWVSPDEAFRLARGPDRPRELLSLMAQAAPHWPERLTEQLARRQLSGAGTVAFDAAWFLSRLTTSAFDRPLLFPGAAVKLGLEGLAEAGAIVAGLASVFAEEDGAAARARALAKALEGVLDTEADLDRPPAWGGEGRLIGEFLSGELAQLGTDVHDGCRAALGTGPLLVRFEPGEPLGLGLGPLRYAEPAAHGGINDGLDSVGSGLIVGAVDPGGAAELAGVQVGMVVSRLSGPDLQLWSRGDLGVPFEVALDEIDRRLASGHALNVVFHTAAPVSHLYAVEMPAAEALAAMRTAQTNPAVVAHVDVGVGPSFAALCGDALLWQEATPRLFLGQPGSVTCAHTDICPQLQLAHGLCGVKVLGVASHAATPHLAAEHADDPAEAAALPPDVAEDEPTFVPTDRPLSARQASLLSHESMTLALLLEGDIAVFDSGALHLASNGAEGLSGAIYHGVMTPAAIPRLRLAAAQPGGSHSGLDTAYGEHLFAADLLGLVEGRLSSLASAE